MFTKSGGIIWAAARELVDEYGEEIAFAAILEAKQTLKDRGVFSTPIMYTGEQVQKMSEKEIGNILARWPV